MIKVVLIDDEKPALIELEYLLRDYQQIEIAGMFTEVQAAIKQIPGINPDIVFLDISMPDVMGMDAAFMISEICPSTKIVFVTAYPEFAVDAFEIYALDYIVKPAVKRRLDITIGRYSKEEAKARTTTSLKISCFGEFSIAWENCEPIKWRTEKTKELFAFLLHNRNREVSKEEIIDALWPESEIEKSVQQLYSAIYYIKKTLIDYGIDQSQIKLSGKYKLKLGRVLFDLDQFNKYIHNAFRGNDVKTYEFAERLYQGNYFGKNDWQWAEIEKEKLSCEYWKIVSALSISYLQTQQYEKAESCLLRVYRDNPYEEKVTEQLMTLYSITSEKAKAVKHYRDYSRTLQHELGINPSFKIQKLNKEICGR